jgi:RND family efflux transporter MFP subunit
MKKFLTRKTTWLVIILIIGGYAFYQNKNKNTEELFTFTTAQKTDIIQRVSVTGKVEPINRFSLTFEQSGKISKVLVKVGDEVKRGQILVEMNSAELEAEMSQAQADLLAAKAKYQDSKNGATDEELFVYEAKLTGAQGTVSDTERELEESVKKAKIDANYAILNKIDSLFENARIYPKLKIRPKDSVKKNIVELGRANIGRILESWELNQDNFYNLETSTNETKTDILKFQDFIRDMANIVNDLSPTSQYSATQINTWQTNVNTAQTTIDSVISNLSATYKAWNSAESSFGISQKELDLKESGATSSSLDMLWAQVKSAEARVQQIKAKIDKTVLHAPIDGMITAQEAKSGEIISLQSQKEILVSMIGTGYEIELNVPEVDIAKISEKDLAEIKFDAFEGAIFNSEVSFIEPGETIVSGVVYYKVKIALDPKTIDLAIRSGMSVDVDIITDKKENVIAIPQRAVVTRGKEKFVQLLREKNSVQSAEEIPVKTGIRGADGKIEILSGIEIGDKIITFTDNKK